MFGKLRYIHLRISKTAFNPKGNPPMKTLITLLSVLTLSISAMAASEKSKVSASKEEAFQTLDLVVGVKQTYSQTSGLQAKVIELLGGDGMNPTRMVLALNTGYTESAKIYFLDSIMMYQVTRITFLAKDVIVINYQQDSFEGEDLKQVQIKKSLKITVQRDAKGELTDEIITEDISKN